MKPGANCDPNEQLESARGLISAGRLDAAAQSLGKIVESDPRSGEAWLLLSAVYGTLHQFDECIRCGERAVTLMPDNLDVRFNLAQAYMHQRRCDAAIPHYLAVIRQRPEHFDSANNLALAYQFVKQDDEAARWLRVAHSLRPDAPTTRFLAAAYRQAEAPNRAPAEYVSSFFNSLAEEFDDLLLRKLQCKTPEELAAIILEKMADCGPIDILDLGCGTGLMALVLKPVTRKIIGVDLSRKMIEKARMRGLYDDLQQGDILDVSLPNAGFDLVVAADVLVYFGECGHFFERARATLRSGGLFVLSTEQGADDGADWYLHTGGRYAHAPRYIRRCARDHGMRESVCRTGTLRLEYGKPVSGNLWAFELP